MPVPILIPPVVVWFAAGATAGVGAGRGVQGFCRFRSAKRIVEEGQDQAKRERRYWRRDLNRLDAALEALHEEKLAAVSNELEELQLEWHRIGRRLAVDPAVAPEEMPEFHDFFAKGHEIDSLDPSAWKAVRSSVVMSSSAALAEVIRLAVVGEVTAIAANATVKAAGLAGAKAGTGKLIADLSGITAQRAALSWLGGGPAAAGGGGMAAGAAAAGAVTVAPVLALAGELVARKGKVKKAEAEKAASKLERQLARSRDQRALMRDSTRGAVQAKEIISLLREVMAVLVSEVRHIADRLEAGEPLADEDREVLFSAWRAASLLGRLLNDQLVATEPASRSSKVPLTDDAELAWAEVEVMAAAVAEASGRGR